VELFFIRLGAGEVIERLCRLLDQVLAKPPTGTAEGWGAVFADEETRLNQGK